MRTAVAGCLADTQTGEYLECPMANGHDRTNGCYPPGRLQRTEPQLYADVLGGLYTSPCPNRQAPVQNPLDEKLPWQRARLPYGIRKVHRIISIPSRNLHELAGYLVSIAYGGVTSPREITKTLSDIFASEDYRNCIKDLQNVGIDPQAYIDGLDKVRSQFVISLAALRSWSLGHQAIGTLPPESDTHERSLRHLRNVCRTYGLLPESHQVKSNPTTGQYTVASGGFSDVWRAANKSGKVLAFKVFRTHEDSATQVEEEGDRLHSPPVRGSLTGFTHVNKGELKGFPVTIPVAIKRLKMYEGVFGKIFKVRLVNLARCRCSTFT